MKNNSVKIIELKNLCKVFDNGFCAVSNFSLDIYKGEFVTFLGPSGCGKTTTLRMIAGFDIPSSGDILLKGRSIALLPPNKRPVNTVFQRYALFPHMNVYENIAFGLRQKRTPVDQITKKIKDVLRLVDLEGFEKRTVDTLSGGQQQRIAIARALVNEPEILLLDEPLGALDLKMRKEMQIELKAMHRELGITFIYVTHDQEEALTMSDKIVVMNEGRIQQTGTPEDIYNEPKNAFVADFIGDSNLFNGTMSAPYTVNFCGADFKCVDDIETGRRITAVVRPEDVILTKPEEGMIQGVVTSVVFKGIHYEIAVESGRNEIVIQNIKPRSVGENVGIKIEPSGIHVMKDAEIPNTFAANLNNDLTLEWNSHPIKADISDLLKDIGDLSQISITAAISPDDIEMTDDIGRGLIHGVISDLIYKGDHYSYVIKADKGLEFSVNDEYLWNLGDSVGLIMPADKMTFSVNEEET